MSLTLTVFPVLMSSDLAINLSPFPGGAPFHRAACGCRNIKKESSLQLCVEIRPSKNNKLHSHRDRPGKLQ